MVVAKSLLGIEHGAYRIEQTAQRNQCDKLPRGVAQKEWEEEYNGPAHHQIYRQANSWYRAAAQRLIEDSKNHHHPLQDKYQPPLPATDYRQRYGRIATRNGEVDEDMVEDMEDIFVARVVQHRMVERRDKEHHKNAHAEDTNAKGHQQIAVAMRVAPHRRKGHSQ